MGRVPTLFISVIASLTVCGIARAGDDNPPPWRGQPGSTTQWFTFLNATDGSNPLRPPQNAYGTPQFTPGPNTTYIIAGDAGNPVPATVWAVGPGGWIDFTIPNRPDFSTGKEIWVQITYFGVTPQVIADGYYPGGNRSEAGPCLDGPVFTPGPGSVAGSDAYTVRLCFDVNPLYEVIRLFNGSATANMYIHQVVIDTICPTPGTAAAGLVGVGLLASRRRR